MARAWHQREGKSQKNLDGTDSLLWVEIHTCVHVNVDVFTEDILKEQFVFRFFFIVLKYIYNSPP